MNCSHLNTTLLSKFNFDVLQSPKSVVHHKYDETCQTDHNLKLWLPSFLQREWGVVESRAKAREAHYPPHRAPSRAIPHSLSSLSLSLSEQLPGGEVMALNQSPPRRTLGVRASIGDYGECGEPRCKLVICAISCHAFLMRGRFNTLQNLVRKLCLQKETEVGRLQLYIKLGC